jgi:hypothetical protein
MSALNRIKFCCFFIILLTRSYGQSIGDYQSNAATMNWSSTTQWQTWNGTTWVTTATPPTTITSGQTVTILSGHVVTNNITTISNSGNIVIAGTLTNAGTPLTNNATGLITVNGTLTNNSTKTITNNGVLINNATLTNNGTINNNLTFTVNSNSSNGSTGTISNAGTLTITSGKTLTNTGAIANNGIINNDGSLAQNLTFTNAAAATINNNGTVSILSGKTLVNNGTFNNSGTISNSGAITNPLSTSLILNSGVITRVVIAATITFSSGSTYKHNFSSSSSATGSIPIATWNSASNCEILACGNGSVLFNTTTFPTSTLGNFIWNNSTQPVDINLNGRLSTIAGSFTLQNSNGKKLILRSTTGNNTSVTGNLNMSAASSTLVLTNGPGTSGTSNHLLTVSGNVNLTAGTIDLTTNLIAGGNGNATFNIGGNFYHTTGVISKSGVTNGTINISGTSTQSIESPGFTSGHAISFNIIQSGFGTARIAAGKTFVINQGTNFTLTDNSSVTDDFIIYGTLTANTNTWNLTSGITTVNGYFINNVNTLINDQSVDSSLLFSSGAVFRLAADGGQSATGTWDPNSTLEITGIVNSDSVGNCYQLFGNILWNSTGQVSSASFSVLDTGTVIFSTQGDFTVSSTGSGTLRFPDVNFTIGNNLDIQNSSLLQVSNGSGLYSPSTRTITINGDVLVSGSATISTGKPNTTVASVSNSARDYIFLLKMNYFNSSSNPLVSFDQRTFGGVLNNESYRLVFNFCGGTTQSFNSLTAGNLAAGTLSNEFVSNSPYSIIVSNNTTLEAASDIKYHSLFIDAGSVLDMTGGNYNLIQYPTLTINNSTDVASTTITGILDLSSGQLTDVTGGNGTFTLSNVSTAEIRTKHANGIATAGSASGCILCAARNYGAAANYTYNGSSNQITGTGLPATLSGILKINNTTPLASGGVTLSQLTTLTNASGILNLSAGKLITTAANLIVIGNSASVSPAGGQTSSFVDGPVQKTGLTTSEFQFPTGNNDKWARIGIIASAASGTNAFTAEYLVSNPGSIDTTLNHTLAGRELIRISSVEYWNLTQSSGSPSAKVKLYWNDGVFSGINNLTDLRIAHYYSALGGSGLKWYGETAALPVVTGTTSAGTIETASAISSFSPFTFGSSAGLNPLPIELISFTGASTQSGNQLKWSTATEINNDYFDLQRSEDGYNFNSISTTEGHGNSSTINNYSFLDSKPVEGTNYYRLKQVDYNGDFTYSEIIALEFKNENSYLSVFPNPTIDNINISLSDEIILVSVYNVLGELIYESKTEGRSETIALQHLSNGVYIVKALSADNKIITTRFTKK